jgi:hypothetical protein
VKFRFENKDGISSQKVYTFFFSRPNGFLSFFLIAMKSDSAETVVDIFLLDVILQLASECCYTLPLTNVQSCMSGVRSGG